MQLKIESWIQKWLKENATEKLLSFMLVVMIIMGFSMREFFRLTISGHEATIKYLKEEKRLCTLENEKKDKIIAMKDKRIEDVELEFRNTLLQLKFNISERIDSLSHEKAKIN